MLDPDAHRDDLQLLDDRGGFGFLFDRDGRRASRARSSWWRRVNSEAASERCCSANGTKVSDICAIIRSRYERDKKGGFSLPVHACVRLVQGIPMASKLLDSSVLKGAEGWKARSVCVHAEYERSMLGRGSRQVNYAS